MNFQAWKMKFLNFMTIQLTIPVSHDPCELIGLRKVIDMTIQKMPTMACVPNNLLSLLLPGRLCDRLLDWFYKLLVAFSE